MVSTRFMRQQSLPSLVLYLECDGKIKICDPFTYMEVSKYLIEHYPQDYADEDEFDDEEL